MRGIRGQGWVASACVVLLCAVPVAAGAACGGTHTARPGHHHKRVRGRAPLAVGDSVMLLALKSLARRGYEANARGCRGFEEGLHLLRHKRRVGRLPHLVVLALGADFDITRREIRRALRIIRPKRRLGLVTPRESGGGAGHDARVVRRAGRRWPKRIKVLDWVRRSRGHRSWFQPDGLHLTYRGAHHYARLMAPAIRWAYPPRARRRR